MPKNQHQQLLTCLDPVGLSRYGITADNTDLNYFLESDVGVFLLEQDRVKEAEAYLEQLKHRRV